MEWYSRMHILQMPLPLIVVDDDDAIAVCCHTIKTTGKMRVNWTSENWGSSFKFNTQLGPQLKQSTASIVEKERHIAIG